MRHVWREVLSFGRRRALLMGVVALVTLGLIGGIAYGVQRFVTRTPNVDVYVVKNQTLTGSVNGSGVIYPAQAVNIVYPVSATVKTVNVHLGQKVTPGQTLITLDSANLTSELQQAYAAYQAAQGYLNSLYASGASASLIDYAQSQVISAKGKYDALNAEMSSPTYSNGNLVAPFAGIVTAVDAVPGSIVRANRKLLSLEDERSVVIRAQASLKERGRVHLGQTAEIDPDATPNETFSGFVTAINAALTRPGSDTFEVWITVANPDLQLLVGESVYARISVHETLPTVPKTAVVHPEASASVFVYARGRAHARKVIVGVRGQAQLGLVSGLTPGEEVIIIGRYHLADNEPVKVTHVQR